MNQPDLGLKVTELRQQKTLTQEQLAEKCEVSARTIQRIESGEVDPRAYTLQCLSEALDFDFMEDNTSKENLWLAALHLSSMLCMLVIPIVIWSWQKNKSYKIDKQGRLDGQVRVGKIERDHRVKMPWQKLYPSRSQIAPLCRCRKRNL